MAFTNIDNPELYMQSKLYTGNGVSGTALTFDNTDTSMQPDWIWGSCRSVGDNNWVMDSVRGNTKAVFTNTQGNEETSSERVKSFDSNGFTIGNAGDTNTSSRTFVAWCWKAGTSFSNDASATGVGTIDSSGSANDTAGFSIVSFTGTGSAGTIKHGLTTAPSWMIVKNRDNNGENWVSFHRTLGAGKNQKLNNTEASQTTSGSWNDTLPTSSVFSVGSFTNVNASGDAMIAYIFSEVQGYSRFTQYVGNGDADGTFVYLGFKPSWLMIKSTGNAESWFIYDNKRPGFNVNVNLLNANNSDAEVTSGANQIDILSNGFKCRATNNGVNRSGDVFNVFAFAESPLTNSNGVPNNAR